MAEASTTDVSRRADRALDAQINERKKGENAAIILAVAGFVAAVVFGALGHLALAGIVFSIPFVLIVRALIGDAGKFFGQNHGTDADSDAP